RAEVPEELDAVFQKMVAKKPRDRYQSMSEVVEALQVIDRQLNASSSGAVWEPGASDTDDYQIPGSSYGGSRSGSQGSAPTVASGSGPLGGGVHGSSFGSTAYADEFPTGGTVAQVGMPLSQKLIVVVLLGLMAGTMGAIYYEMKNNTEVVSTNPEVIEKEVIVKVPPDPPPIYLPPFTRPAKGSGISTVKTPAGDLKYYDVIEIDTSKLPKLPMFPGGPAIAEKPEVPPNPGDPAVAERPAPVVRFRLITAKNNPQLRPFYIMEDKVWSNLFQAFAKANPYKIEEDSQWMLNPPGRQPIFYVNLQEAHWFARWMGGQLPSGPEWDTAAGYYIPEDDREQTVGPFKSPLDPLEKPNVAVYGEQQLGESGLFEPVKPAESMDDPFTDDVGPLGVRYMAGNGEEFTRSTQAGELEVSEDYENPKAEVLLRGMPFFHIYERPLDYEIMKSKNAGSGDEHWGLARGPSDTISFRVVLPIPKEE
ncbi:MAG: SUMF1/EgtB/PvdO family nonheme iron enzyme, partial [Planctomycetaceae bacterium]|nr:SUMF1/EgtB/PvdO family nonheme iron enzyme [Planctomycetaceae bacterium]